MTEPYMNSAQGPPGRLRANGSDAPAAYDDLAADQDWSASAATSLVSLAFLKAALSRSARFCCLMAVAGFLAGFGIYLAAPAPYQATTSVLLTYSPYENGMTAAADNQAIAQTHTVARLAMHKLGLHESVGSFLAAYTTTVVSSRVLLFTFTAPSASQALHGAGAVAAAFLQFRASQLDREEGQVVSSLRQQLNHAKQQVSSTKAEISRVSAQPASPAQQSGLTHLRAELSQETAALPNFQQALNNNQVNIQPANAAAVKTSQVLDAAASLPYAHIRHLLLYPSAGLIGGLAAGIAIVLVRAIVSDRLRRRDDVADALGAPVKLSTGRLRPGRGPFRRRHAAAREADIRRIAGYLGNVAHENARSTATLAVVAVDNARAAALPLVRLAASSAQQGQRVVLADLASGAPAAKLLGCGAPGVNEADAEGARLVIAVPQPDDIAPIGPLTHGAARERSAFSEAVVAACAQPDLALTLIMLDPSCGGDHLPTWAANAVVVVTAGQSSWTKINAVGEMIRLSGTRLVSAALIGADRTDESLGAIPAEHSRGDANAVGQGLHSDSSGFMLPVVKRQPG